MTQYIAWLLGFENVRSIDAIHVTLAAPWAGEHLWAVIGTCVIAIGGVVTFYRHFENCKSRALRVTLATLRAGAVVSVAFDSGGTVGSQFGDRFAATAGVPRTG